MAYSLLLQGILGSTAYGLAHENSDVDRLGIFARDISELIGWYQQTETYSQHDPDITIHEVGKYMHLAAKSNPTVLELLYAKDYEFVTNLGQLLIDHRSWFLSEKYVRNAYGGYATGQFGKWLGNADGTRMLGMSDQRKTKLAKHTIRLLIQGQELLRKNTINLDMSSHRDLIFHAGWMALNDKDGLVELYQDLLTDFNNSNSVLPQEPHEDLPELLQEIRWRNHEGGRTVILDKLEDIDD